MRRLRVMEEGDGAQTGIVPLGGVHNALAATLGEGGEDAVIAAVDAALLSAAHHRASDLHFEPWDDCLGLRFRIDGILHDVARIPSAYQAKIAARIKILARIVVYQRDLPQDGRIEPEATPCGLPMRVSTVPTVNGEKIVVRVMHTNVDDFSLDALGFQRGVVAALRAFGARPQGTLLLTGPSSSGKTTTIYSLLRELESQRDTRPHIVTVEDPVERRLDRVAQTQVNPAAGFTFAAALRALLRQDPEVIMLGEIRAPETARAAIQAGLTGHLVISTIHSGTAAGVFTRLLDMGIEPYLIASSLTGVLAQRLVRKVCGHCAAPYEPDPALLARFGLADASGVFKRGAGCEHCQGIGYRERGALGEILIMNSEISEMLLSRPRTRDVHAAAMRGRMVSLAEDGRARVKDGTTTVDELKRVLPWDVQGGDDE